MKVLLGNLPPDISSVEGPLTMTRSSVRVPGPGSRVLGPGTQVGVMASSSDAGFSLSLCVSGKPAASGQH